MKKKKEEFIVEKKIREVKFDKRTYLFYSALALISFNIIMILAVLFLIFAIHILFLQIIDGVLGILCILRSIMIYFHDTKCYHYAIHKNCIVYDAVYSSVKIDFNSIIEVKAIKTIMDKISRRKTSTLLIKQNSKIDRYIMLRYISEDCEKLADEINEYVKQYKANQL